MRMNCWLRRGFVVSTAFAQNPNCSNWITVNQSNLSALEGQKRKYLGCMFLFQLTLLSLVSQKYLHANLCRNSCSVVCTLVDVRLASQLPSVLNPEDIWLVLVLWFHYRNKRLPLAHVFMFVISLYEASYESGFESWKRNRLSGGLGVLPVINIGGGRWRWSDTFIRPWREGKQMLNASIAFSL